MPVSAHRAFALAALLLSLSSLSAGCGEAEIDQVPVFPVRGKLLVGSQPAAGAMLTLHPATAAAATSLRSLAIVAEDGQYEFTTYRSADGAPQGEFVLTAYWPDARRATQDPDGESEQLPPDLLGGRFSNPSRSPLRIRVTPGENHLAPLDLNDRAIGATEFVLPQQDARNSS